MPTMRRSLAPALVLLLMPTAGDGPGGAVAGDSGRPGLLALVGGRILTQAEAGEVEGTILVRDGRIAAVGDGVAVPEGAEVVDLAGMIVVPGLIDARGVLWLPAESRRDGANDGGLDVLDGVDPYAEDWPEVVRSGVTAVAVLPANTGLFGGRGAVLRAGPGGTTADDLAIRADAFVQAALGVNDASGNAVLRHQQSEQLKRALDGVKRYKEAWETYREAKEKFDEERARARTPEAEEEDAGGDPEGADDAGAVEDDPDEDDPDEPEGGSDDPPGGDGADGSKADAKEPAGPPKEPERDATKEFLVGLLGGEVPLRIEAHREDDVRNALRLAEQFGLALIVEGLSAPRSAGDELIKRRTPMVLGPILERGARPAYRRDRDRDWPGGLLADDSRWALGTFGDRPADSSLLRAHAAAAVARGVPRDRALRAMTSGAAEVLGLADELGAIAEGRRADLVAFAGDPLDPSVPAALVVVGGEVVHRDPSARPIDGEAGGPVTVVDASLPDRLPRRFVVRSRRLLGPDGSTGPGALSVRDGAIVASGMAVEEESDVPAFDVGDAVLSPGLLTAHGTLGQGRAAAEAAGADAGFLRAVDAFDPTGRTVRALAGGGVLRAGFAPAPVNVVGGAVGAVRLGAAEPVAEPVIGMNLVLSGPARIVERYPASLPGQVSVVRQFLGLEDSEGPAGRRRLDYYLADAAIDRLDASRRERAERIRAGDCGAFLEVDGPAEVEAALDLADALGVRVVLVGPGAIEEHAGRVARQAGGAGLVLVLRPIEPGPEATRRLGAVVDAEGAGALVLFAAEDPEELRLLAASAVALGLPRRAALRALAGGLSATGEDVDPWEAGAPADFVVWDGSPLDLASRPLAVVVDGRILP